mmetsp:Transcript_102655/g.260758  ORF Transcript_102655/g.260758 Transcript_102655/m.260758 type:complete len:391 (-) Transcript_102655:50-1222(-)
MASTAKGRAWDIVGIGTVGLLGVMGVRRRHELSQGPPVNGGANRLGRDLELEGVHGIVTGASSGIGMEVAWGLAKAGSDRVDMACRNLGRCEKARADLLARCLTAPPADDVVQGFSLGSRAAAGSMAAHRRGCSETHRRLVCAHLELTEPKSIRNFAGEVKSRSNGCRMVLVNNAGVMGEGGMDQSWEIDAGDFQLWTNHYGHFLLTCLLLPAMGAGSVVAMVASRAHRQGSLVISCQTSMEGDALSSESVEGTTGLSKMLTAIGLGWYARYARSKLCNVLFAAELQRRYPDCPACVAISPGLVNTELLVGAFPPALSESLRSLSAHFLQTPAQGASHVLIAVAAAADTKLDELPLYWHCGKPELPSAAAQHTGLAAALWRASEDVVGLS